MFQSTGNRTIKKSKDMDITKKQGLWLLLKSKLCDVIEHENTEPSTALATHLLMGDVI